MYKQIYRNLFLTKTEKETGIGYYYCITAGAGIGLEAFRTEEEFNAYLQRTGLTVEFRSEFESKECGHTELYSLIGCYHDALFWSMNEIPEDAQKFIGLSNGSYVNCFYADVDGIRTIFRPNPNAKEVYKPVDKFERRI